MMKLNILQAGEPVLRKIARALAIEEILSNDIQTLIQSMKETLWNTGVGLAAPQIGESLQLIIIEDHAELMAHLTPEQIAERERSIVPLHVIINPKLTINEEKYVEFFEGCLSVAGFVSIVSRAHAVTVECLNEKAQPVVIQADGWYARILQHEIDHLHGTLCIDRMKPRSLTTIDNHQKYWKDKSIAEVCDELRIE